MIFQNAIVLLITRFNVDGVCVLCELCNPFFGRKKKSEFEAFAL